MVLLVHSWLCRVRTHIWVHKDDEGEESVPSTAYRTFVKEQTAILREDIAFTFCDQRERMVEIGKRWQAKKRVENQQPIPPMQVPIPTPVQDPSTSRAAASRPHVIGRPATRRITRASASQP